MSRHLILVACTVLAAGCASSQSTSQSQDAATTRRDRSVILAEDMDKVQALNLYEVVQRLHPEWLNTRQTSTVGQRSGTTTSDYQVQVYLDTQRAGNVEILKSMAVRSASSLRYYSASDAQVKFGSGNLNGAIQVITTTR